MPAVTANLTAVGSAAAFTPAGNFNAELSGTFDAQVCLERSLNSGTTWVPVAVDLQGNANSFSRPVSFTATEAEATAQYRWTVTRYGSGTVAARLSN